MMLKAGQRIFGVDPGSQVAGFAVIEAKRSQPFRPEDFCLLDVGVVRLPRRLRLNERLGHLHQAMHSIGQRWQPRFCVIEQSFVGINVHSALRLGEARGAVASATEGLGVITYEITPAKVKQAIAGSGRASKEDVRLALARLLRQETAHLPLDASDALAIALAFGILGPSGSSNQGSSLQAVARRYAAQAPDKPS
jgi:crossover junction endodeoxyribonuclease RuvC